MRTRIALVVAIAVLSTEAIIASTVLGLRWMNITLKRPAPQVHVDTVRSVVYDTVTVVSRARDTVRILEYKVGPLTEQRIARLICGKNLTYGDERDRFEYNQMHMIFCPK